MGKKSDVPDLTTAGSPVSGTSHEELKRQIERDFMPHIPVIAKGLRRLYPNEPDLDDVLQEALVRIMDRLETISIEKPEAYLFRTAVSFVVDLHRRRRASPVEGIGGPLDLESLDIASPAPAIDRTICARETWQRVNAAYASLSPKRRSTIHLRRGEGLSIRETAARMQTGYSVIEKHMSKATRLLAEAAREPEPADQDNLRPLPGFARRYRLAGRH